MGSARYVPSRTGPVTGSSRRLGLGNHERYAQAEAYTQYRAGRLGMQFLRGEAASLKIGSSRVNRKRTASTV